MRPHPDADDRALGCAVLTLSDTRIASTDRSGQLITQLLTGAGHQVNAYDLVADETAFILDRLSQWHDRADIQVILLNGGTGIAARDTTYETIAALLTKPMPGFGELFRTLSYAEIGSRAMASRAIAGVYDRQLIFAMPGSSNAVNLAMTQLILPELRHLVSQIKG